MTGEINSNFTKNNSYYSQCPIKTETYVDNNGNTYASYNEYVETLKDNYYIRFKKEALIKEERYEALKGIMSSWNAKKNSLFIQWQRNRDNILSKQKYDDAYKSYSDSAMGADCAWWSWHDAVDSQRRAIII